MAATMAAAAAAATSVRRTRPSSGRTNILSVKEPVSFHLALLLGNEYVLPIGKNSVDVLRTPFQRAAMDGAQGPSSDSPAFRRNFSSIQINQPKSPNLTGTRLELWAKKYVSSQCDSEDFDKAWQDRLLIATEKRIFIVTRKKLNTKLEAEGLLKGRNKTDDFGCMDRHGSPFDLEIVDSIPTNEIASISLDDDNAEKPKEVQTMQSSIARSFRHTATILNILPANSNKDSRKARPEAPELCLNRFFESGSPSIPSARENFCEQILSITTAPAGFNHGQTYHFLLRKQDYPCVDGDDAISLRNRADAEALAARLSTLAARRRAESDRETRFLRLQRRLRRAWDSILFNLVLLVLIVSNFVFTVEQLQNTDPSRQPFFEHVDLAYTVIFTLGPPKPITSTQLFASTSAPPCVLFSFALDILNCTISEN